jgi:hypothetical protein
MATVYNNFNSSSGFAAIRPFGGTSVCNVNAGTAYVKAGNGFLRGLTVSTSTFGIMDIYDGTSFAGNLMYSSIVLTKGTNFDLQGSMFTTGLFVNLNGAGNITIRFN